MDDPSVKWEQARYAEVEEKLTPFLKGCGYNTKKARCDNKSNNKIILKDKEKGARGPSRQHELQHVNNQRTINPLS